MTIRACGACRQKESPFVSSKSGWQRPDMCWPATNVNKKEMTKVRKYLEETQALSMGFPLPKKVKLTMKALIWLLKDFAKEENKEKDKQLEMLQRELDRARKIRIK